ncbi:MAG: hypothetical protein QJR09_10975 [Micrococcus sp.]|nr:hypothetical protein [Micrococcus sp.]
MNSQQDDNVAATAQHGEQISAAVPGLVRAFGQDSVGTLSETSCTSSPDPETASRNTRWEASTATSVPTQQEARALADAVRQHAEAQGWQTQDREAAHPSLERLYSAVREDLTLVMDADDGGEDVQVRLSVTSPCLEKPAGHTMARSELDPMYGSPDPMYPNDDRSKFTNGTPRPLPAPSE